MTLDELKRCCEEAIAFQEKLGHCQKPNFNVMIPRVAHGKKTKVMPGLWGENLGHYPHYKEGTWDVAFWGTMVSIELADAQKWIEKAEAEM